MRTLCCLFSVLALSIPARTQDEAPAWHPPMFNRPTFSFGAGVLEYREHDFDLAPGLESRFSEPVFQYTFGWEFVTGNHDFYINMDFFHSLEGTEKWKESGETVQTDDLDILRFGLELGYMASTWDRALPPPLLPKSSQAVRFAGGLNLYYRHQHFERDDFVVFDPFPEPVDFESDEMFDMLGGEVVLELEFGPRHILAGFIRGKGGGGYVSVVNDIFDPYDDDAQINTASVQGTVEVGILSQFLPHVELRLGYRWHRLEVFGEDTTVDGVLLVELPDNTTEIHMGFLEAVFPF